MPFCPKCGKENPEEAVFCLNCGQNLKETNNVAYRRERSEKSEKDTRGEKSEKNEKNEGPGAIWSAVMGGLILLWLGVSYLLRQNNYISRGNWWSVFTVGVGLLLVARGILFYTQKSNWQAASGMIAGGLILALISIASYMGVSDWWPFIIILIGVFVIIGALMGRKTHPRP
jgi:hypothetical protein